MTWRSKLQNQVEQLLHEASCQLETRKMDRAIEAYRSAAALLEDLGELDTAIEIYEKLVSCTSGRLQAGFIAYIERLKERGSVSSWDGTKRLRGPKVENRRNGGLPPEGPDAAAFA